MNSQLKKEKVYDGEIAKGMVYKYLTNYVHILINAPVHLKRKEKKTINIFFSSNVFLYC